ncbi:MAG: hypothetical protein IJA61_00680 [Clostridia bacterium]|nr:hypothetical protein [Clostridia bacterium]
MKFLPNLVDVAIQKYGLGYAAKTQTAKQHLTSFIGAAAKETLDTFDQEKLHRPRCNYDYILDKLFGEPQPDGSLFCEAKTKDGKNEAVLTYELRPTEEGFTTSIRSDVLEDGFYFGAKFEVKRKAQVSRFSENGVELQRERIKFSQYKVPYIEAKKLIAEDIENLPCDEYERQTRKNGIFALIEKDQGVRPADKQTESLKYRYIVAMHNDNGLLGDNYDSNEKIVQILDNDFEGRLTSGDKKTLVKIFNLLDKLEPAVAGEISRDMPDTVKVAYDEYHHYLD